MATWTRADDAPPLWTGHQPWPWHPGILAKYLAVDAACSAARSRDPAAAPCINLVVDHDAHDTLRLTVPVRDASETRDVAWRPHTLQLAPTRPDVPPGCQPAVDNALVVRALTQLHHEQPDLRLEPLIAAWHAQPARDAPSLGHQMAAVLRSLLSPWLACPWEDRFSTALCAQPWFAAELSALLHDARDMATAYNRAVASVPDAGVTPLATSRELIELPVWLLGWNQPRRRVYADLADATPWLVDEHGRRFEHEQPLGRDSLWLAPKALWMTALLRRRTTDCAGFVHGTGGLTYDRAMQHWWTHWRGEPLAPMALATADLTLDLPGPTATPQEHRRAVWLAHHLPHNLDRIQSVAAAHPELVAEKADLLAHMHDDRDRRRRRAAFERLHTLNAALADAHHVLIDRAQRQRRQTELGLRNAALSARRDWPFAIYPDESIAALADTIRAAFA